MISKIWFNVSTPLRKVFICNIEIGNSNWLLCNTVAVSEMNLFACGTISFHNSFVWEYFVSNVPIWTKCACFYEDVFSSIWIQIVSWYNTCTCMSEGFFFTCHFIFLWNFNRKQRHALAHIVLKVFFVLKLWHCCCVLFSTSGNFSILP